jgi:hypothetical protein
MIKMKTNDTMRKNALRSPTIMMTHPLCSQETPGIQIAESVPTAMLEDVMKIPIDMPNMMR